MFSAIPPHCFYCQNKSIVLTTDIFILKLIIYGTVLATAIATQTVFPVIAGPQPAVVLGHTTQVPPEIKEALKKFTALNSRLEVGLNFQDYANQVSDLKVILDQIPEETKANPVYLNLTLAFENYKLALSVWQSYLREYGRHGFFAASSEYGSLLTKDYKVRTTNIDRRQYIYLSDALSAVWGQASMHINNAKAQ